MTSWRSCAATTHATALTMAGVMTLTVWSASGSARIAAVEDGQAQPSPTWLASQAAAPELPSHYLHSIGGTASPGGFTLPQRLAASPDGGDVLLTDAASHRVQAHTLSGSLLTAWGGFGTAEGRFSVPDGVAVGADGRVVVADRANERVQVFDYTGRLVDVWREYHDPDRPGRARLIRPTDVAIAPGGDVLVADWYDNRVLRFDASGSLVASWGAGGSEPGGFVGLTGLDVGADGRVYTVEWGTDRLQVFDGGGVLLDVWHPGQSADVAARGKHVYVVGGKLFGVRWLDRSGTVVGEIPLGETGDSPEAGAITSARSVAVRPDGSLLVLEANAGGQADRVVRFDADGSFLDAWSGGAPSAGLILPSDVAVDPAGRVIVADPTHGQVQRFHADGRHESIWAGGREPREDMVEPAWIAAGSDGDVFVSDRATRRVLRLDDFGAVGLVIGDGDGDSPGEFGDQGPGDVAFTHLASSQPQLLYVADAGNTRVQAFDRDGNARLQFGQEGKAPEDFCGGCVGHVAAAPGGAVYVTERSSLQRVLAHSWSGEHWFTFEGNVGQDSRFAPLTGIAYCPPDRLYLADPRMRVQAFATDGRHIGDWATHDARAGTRIEPAAVAADSSGRVYVADAYGGMVHVFGTTQPTDWRVEMFANGWVAGAPAAIDHVDSPEMRWGAGSPGPGLPADGFSARLYGEMAFPVGASQLEVEVKGGCRVWIGSRLVIDEWRQQATTHIHGLGEPPDDPRMVVEYVNVSGPAELVVRLVAGTPGPQPRAAYMPRLEVSR